MVVSASIFLALPRTGCAVCMSHARAGTAANAAALRAMGIDLVEKMGAGNLVVETGPSGLLTEPHEDFSVTAQVLAWLAGRGEVTIVEVAAGAPWQPGRMGVQNRVRHLLRRLGCRQVERSW
jgi:hypothetical protein